MSPTAESVVEALFAHRSDDELATVRKRLAPDEPAIGVRMRHLFDIAEANTDLPLAEVDRLLDHEAYEPRMAAACILDFQARRQLDDRRRGDLYELYLRRHDRITTWDMVDRSAPRVVGSYLIGRSKDPLWQLARSSAPLRRRTAMTAPLAFVRWGTTAIAATAWPSPPLWPATRTPWCTNRSASSSATSAGGTPTSWPPFWRPMPHGCRAPPSGRP